MLSWGNRLRRSAALCAPAFTLAAVAMSARAQGVEGVKVGDRAPDFRLRGSDGKEYTLSQYKDRSAVVIAWYPKALTAG